MNPAAKQAWARTKIVVAPGRYVLAELAPESLGRAAARVGSAFSAIIVEAGAVSLIVEESAWDAEKLPARAIQRGYRVVTLEAEVAPDLSGYLAPAAARLAEAGIPIIPVCGAPRDHLLVRDQDLDRARKILEDLVRECSKIAAP
jgi:hypothetical protein